MKIKQCTEEESEVLANIVNCKIRVKDTTYVEEGPYYAYCTNVECQVPFDTAIEIFKPNEVEVVEWRDKK